MASSSASPPSAPRTSKGPTGFFSLPRELRDLIYDHAYEETHYSEKPSDLNHSTRRREGTLYFDVRAALPQPRLVSRQLKREYDQRSPANSRLSISGRNIGLCRYWEYLRLDARHVIKCQPTKVDMALSVRTSDLGSYCAGMLYGASEWLQQIYCYSPLFDTLNLILHFIKGPDDHLHDWFTCDYLDNENEHYSKIATRVGRPDSFELRLLWSPDETSEPLKIATWTPALWLVWHEEAIAECKSVMSRG